MRNLLLALAAASAVHAFAADFPEAQISNGAVTAKLYMPDAEKGYYRGTRFDWSGQIGSLQVGNRQYFGQWFDKYDPKLHDSIMGPVEEFLTGDSSLGYEEAPVGGTFVRIGVGTVRKPDSSRYQRFRTYEIIDPGVWTIRPGKDKIEFIHELTSETGYAYRYTKTVRLPGDKPEMIIEHALKNTGKKPIPTSQYNHNFFVTGQPTGPGTVVDFPFELKPKQPFNSPFAEIRGDKVVYTKELTKGVSVATEFAEGFGPTAKDFDIRVEDRKAGTGVRIQGDRPIQKVIFWSIRTTVCPEAYINLDVPTGKEQKWTYRYTFYEVPPAP
jgi:hypothetical protein